MGGGAAGLQAALTLGRMRIGVIVVDAGMPSNAPADAIGGLLGADHVSPLDFLAGGRAQLSELPTVRLIEGDVTRVEADRTVELDDGTSLDARAVLLATGMDYAYPDLPGAADLWGTSVIHCPFCHGWEVRDASIGLLGGDDEHVERLLPMLRRLSADVEVFEAITAVRGVGGVLRAVVLPDGSEVPLEVLFVAAPPTARDASFAHLELGRNGPLLETEDLFGKTSIPGIYAAGDLVTPAPAVVQALASAQRAAVGITRELSVS
ncbi:MAG TPA: NAD(P)/FAD-dependent oxidoreductase [Thermoleophilaceae bacterium]|nr:NAD(P)/FAD-dependent oxidoreductase [Thermoleophilaceae bacterium]